jgi:hypothetical protein
MQPANWLAQRSNQRVFSGKIGPLNALRYCECPKLVSVTVPI